MFVDVHDERTRSITNLNGGVKVLHEAIEYLGGIYYECRYDEDGVKVEYLYGMDSNDREYFTIQSVGCLGMSLNMMTDVGGTVSIVFDAVDAHKGDNMRILGFSMNGTETGSISW